jgi:hypothetical protein
VLVIEVEFFDLSYFPVETFEFVALESLGLDKHNAVLSSIVVPVKENGREALPPSPDHQL